MDNKISNLEQLRIHELRDLARKMGVQAPTILKKEEIIEEIRKIMSGESEPFTRVSKKGRPARTGADNFDVVDFILPKPENLHEVNDEQLYDFAQDKFSYVLNMESASYGNEKNEPHECSGCVEVKPEGYGVLHTKGICPSNDDVFISKNIVKQLNLKSGEMVKAWAKLIKEGYPENAYEITRKSPESTLDFDSENAVKLDGGVKINDDLIDFKLGGRYFIKTNADVYSVVPQVADSVIKNVKNAKVITFYLNAMRERINYNEIKLDFVPFNKMDDEIMIAAELFFEKCKRLAEQGNNVVVVLSGLSQLAKSCNAVFLKNNNYQEVSPKTVFVIKNILATAKKISENCSISLICVDDLKVPKNIQEMFEFEILPLF